MSTNDGKFEDYQRDNSTQNYASLDEVIEWIIENIKPEDVYPEDDLIKWAEQNGFVKETENE